MTMQSKKFFVKSKAIVLGNALGKIVLECMKSIFVKKEEQLEFLNGVNYIIYGELKKYKPDQQQDNNFLRNPYL